MSRPAPSLCLVGLLLVLAGLGGCSILPQSPPQDIYRLPPPSVPAAGAGLVPVSLRVARPAAGDVLAGSRIAVVPAGNRLSVYSGARWSSPAPLLLRDHLLDAFRSDGRIERLSSDGEGLQADLEIGGTLRAFQVEYREGGPEAIIRLDARLVETAGRRIVASRRFVVRAGLVGDEQVPAVVEAFGRAADRLTRQLIDWTLQQVP